MQVCRTWGTRTGIGKGIEEARTNVGSPTFRSFSCSVSCFLRGEHLSASKARQGSWGIGVLIVLLRVLQVEVVTQ